MATPIFSFDAELLTDAPFEHIHQRICEAGAVGFRCLKPLHTWAPADASSECIRLSWERRAAGTLEQGSLVIRPDAKGAHLRLEGRLKGWAGFLLFGWMRWRTDRLLDRLVEEL